MTCPDTGTWRAWLDAEADAPVGHLDGCSACTAEVADLRAASEHAATAIAVLAPPLRAVAAATAIPPAELASVRRPRTHWQRAAAGVAAAVVAVAVVVTPSGQTALADFLAAFRSERFTVVTMQPGDAEQTAFLLSQLGEVDGQATPGDITPVADVATAEALVGFPLLLPDPATVPDDASATPRISVSEGGELRMRFDVAATRAYLASMGSDLAIPEGYDGAVLRVTVPAGALLDYGVGAQGRPTLVVGQAGVITAAVDGAVGLETLRAFLLDLPGLPPRLGDQLRAIEDWRGTLPVPVQADLGSGIASLPGAGLAMTPTTVAGADGLQFNQPGFGSVLVWQRDGRITAVAGMGAEADVRAVAEGLR